jgi:hypothetical protein
MTRHDTTRLKLELINLAPLRTSVFNFYFVLFFSFLVQEMNKFSHIIISFLDSYIYIVWLAGCIYSSRVIPFLCNLNECNIYQTYNMKNVLNAVHANYTHTYIHHTLHITYQIPHITYHISHITYQSHPHTY